MYLKTYECNDGKIRGVTQFITRNGELREDDIITFCNTDFKYDVGYSCFSNGEKPYWYSCKIRFNKEYVDDETKPAIGGTSGNYHYKEYIVDEILAEGVVDDEDNITYVTLDGLDSIGELAHVPTKNYMFDYSDLNVEKIEEVNDLEKVIDKFKHDRECWMRIMFNTGFYIIYRYGELYKIYNPHVRIAYTVHADNYGMAWAKEENNTSGMDVVCVYTYNPYNKEERLYIEVE